MKGNFSFGLFLTYTLLILGLNAQNQFKADSIRTLLESDTLKSNDKLDAYYYLSAYSSSPEEELRYGQLLLQLAQDANSTEYLIKSKQRIGVAHRLMGNLEKALTSLFEAAGHATDKSFEPLLADIYTEISTCYTLNGDSDNAFRYGLATIDILRRSGKKQELGINLLNLGYDHYLVGNYDSAMSYYMEAEPIFEEIDMPIGQAYLIGNRALVFWKMGNLSKAKTDLLSAIERLDIIGDPFGMSDYYNQLGYILLEEKSNERAINYALEGLAIAERENFKEQIRDASNLLSLLYKATGEYQKALDYQGQFYAYKDSIQNLEATQELANLRTIYEVGLKQAEVDLLLEQKRSNRIIMITGGAILFIVIVLSIVIYTYSRSKVRLSEQLEIQKDELIELNNAKDKFFSIISHDLRGPVNNLSGLVNVTKHYLDKDDIERFNDMLDKMEFSVDRLVKLLDNLLQWALLQRDRFPYQPIDLSLKEVLTESTEMFSHIATTKSIEVDVQIPEDFQVYADKNSTYTMFRNLLSNAIKFTPNGGKIQIVAEKNETMGIIKFIDNGIGIPKKKLKTLFNLKENITTKGTSGETGLGLGLQLVYDFIHLNRGSVDVESTEGEGTTFTLRLPLNEKLN